MKVDAGALGRFGVSVGVLMHMTPVLEGVPGFAAHSPADYLITGIAPCAKETAGSSSSVRLPATRGREGDERQPATTCAQDGGAHTQLTSLGRNSLPFLLSGDPQRQRV
jgi:hypothetical protein